MEIFSMLFNNANLDTLTGPAVAAMIAWCFVTLVPLLTLGFNNRNVDVLWRWSTVPAILLAIVLLPVSVLQGQALSSVWFACAFYVVFYLVMNITFGTIGWLAASESAPVLLTRFANFLRRCEGAILRRRPS